MSLGAHTTSEVDQMEGRGTHFCEFEGGQPKGLVLQGIMDSLVSPNEILVREKKKKD